MSFKKTFLSILNEDLKPYQKNPFRGAMRPGQQWVPDSHKTDLSLNSKIESLRNKSNGMLTCDINDLVYILNNYIFQGDQQPANRKNAFDLASKHLSSDKGKNLGTTGIVISLDPTTNIYKLKK